MIAEHIVQFGSFHPGIRKIGANDPGFCQVSVAEVSLLKTRIVQVRLE
jgi:hypothetical protein